MNDMLSQDEINALLNGMDLSEGAGADDEAAAPVAGGTVSAIDESLLSDVEKDAVGEVANISMGSSATTLYSLVNQKVNIT
ncbi:MAG: chemotaxis protein CheC, partial [Lachnospiraceae bacterium]|nr:chemotaxis protein CheC [Lachnospiraceae bacterium]